MLSIILIIVIIILALYTLHLSKEINRITKNYRAIIQKNSQINILYNFDIEQHKNIENNMASTITQCADAVRFAMTCAHPDEPRGSNDKFIEYRKLYEELIRVDERRVNNE